MAPVLNSKTAKALGISIDFVAKELETGAFYKSMFLACRLRACVLVSLTVQAFCRSSMPWGHSRKASRGKNHGSQVIEGYSRRLRGLRFEF